MSSKTIYHYVYRITNTIEDKHYYGTRTSKVHPSKDLGKRYFSSSNDKDFKKDQKENPQNYKYKVIKIFDTREEALAFEIRLHEKFDVGVNESFYNKAKQTNVGFDATGTVTVRDTISGNILQCSVDDPLYKSGRYVYIFTGSVCVRDMTSGNTFRCSVDDPRYVSGELRHVAAGLIIVKDKETGATLACPASDPRYVSGRYVPTWAGRFHSEETKKKISESQKGTLTVKDPETGETFKCQLDDPLYLSGKYVHVCTGNKASEETRKKFSEAAKNRPKVKCKYCDMESSSLNINRWHNENCKHKPKED